MIVPGTDVSLETDGTEILMKLFTVGFGIQSEATVTMNVTQAREMRFRLRQLIIEVEGRAEEEAQRLMEAAQKRIEMQAQSDELPLGPLRLGSGTIHCSHDFGGVYLSTGMDSGPLDGETGARLTVGQAEHLRDLLDAAITKAKENGEDDDAD